MFSVIIPTLNEEKFLPNLLRSLQEQTQKNFEVIVVDGSSKDKTVAVAKAFPGVQVIVSKKASLPLQRNLGAKAAKGDWLVFVDADSVLLPNFIERLSEYIHKEHPSFVTTWMRPDSEKLGDANISLLANLMLEIGVSLRKPLPTGPLTAVSRHAFELVGGYNEEHAYNEDVEFSSRILKAKITQRIIPETLYIWSLRRLRKQGAINVIQKYILSALPVLLFNRPLRFMPGYAMGGHLYDKKKDQSKLQKLLKELFS